MALPKIDTPIYDLTLPLSKKEIRFRPFLVKEQKNLLMAMEADDKESIEKNVKQVLHEITKIASINVHTIKICFGNELLWFLGKKAFEHFHMGRHKFHAHIPHA